VGAVLIWLASIGGYTGIALIAYRLQFRKTYRRYLNWQREDPDTLASWYDDYSYGSFPKVKRKDLEYRDWFHLVGPNAYVHEWHEFTPIYMFAWPFVGLFAVARGTWVYALNPFLHPKGLEKGKKRVDYDKINK
jgi:H+/Cl- antiporter ClcA